MSILRKIGFVEDKVFTVNIGKDEFIRKFKTEVREGSSSLWFRNPFEAFTSYDESYIGTLDYSKFEIRNLISFGNSFQAMSKMKGKITGNNDTTTINVTFLTGHTFLPFLIVFPLIYGISIIGVLISSMSEGDGSGLAFLPFLLLHASFMFGIFWFIMRKSHLGTKKQFEKDLVYIAHK